MYFFLYEYEMRILNLPFRRFVVPPPAVKSLWWDVTRDEADVNGVELLTFIENLLFIFDDDCCFDVTLGLVRDSLGELCAEYVDWGEGEDEASTPGVPCTIFRKYYKMLLYE